eukprot:scaffold415_cov124-Isochrysis_galbana.AAC.5
MMLGMGDRVAMPVLHGDADVRHSGHRQIASAPRSLAGMPNRSRRRFSARFVPRADMTGRQPSAPATASGRAS